MFLSFSSVPRHRKPLTRRTFCDCRHPNCTASFPPLRSRQAHWLKTTTNCRDLQLTLSGYYQTTRKISCRCRRPGKDSTLRELDADAEHCVERIDHVRSVAVRQILSQRLSQDWNGAGWLTSRDESRMLTNFTRRTVASAAGRRPITASRRVQFRLLVLVFLIMTVLVLMREARKPENWHWMWQFQDATCAGQRIAGCAGVGRQPGSLGHATRAAAGHGSASGSPS